MSKSDLRIKKIIKIWGQVCFYSVISYLFACGFGVTYFEKKNFIAALFPVTSNQYWYFTSYIVVLFLSMALNSFFEKGDKKQLMLFMLSLFYFFALMPMWGYYALISDDRIGTMVLLYCIGAYIRKYHAEKSKIGLKVELCVGLLLFLMFSYFSVFYDKHDVFRQISGDRFGLIWGIEKFPIIIFSSLVFLIFKNIEITFCRAINEIAGSAFGVYLLHMNGWTTHLIWEQVCRTKDYYQEPGMIGHVLLCCVMIYAFCTIIDKIRIYVLNGFYKIFYLKL